MTPEQFHLLVIKYYDKLTPILNELRSVATSNGCAFTIHMEGKEFILGVHVPETSPLYAPHKGKLGPINV